MPDRTRHLRPSLVLLLLVGLAGGSGVRAEGKGPPTGEEIAQAVKDLEMDQVTDSQRALNLLARTGKRKEQVVIADYATTTSHLKMTILCARLLGEADVLKRELTRLQRSHKKRPEGMVRVAMMGEQLGGKDGVRFLLGLTKAKNTKVAYTSIRALGARKEESARAALLTLVGSKRAPVAMAAAFSLSQLPSDQTTINALFKRVVSGNKADRVGDACAVALCRMEPNEDLGVRTLNLIQKRGAAYAVHGLSKVARRHSLNAPPDLVLKLTRAANARAREIGCDIAGLGKMKDPALQKQLMSVALKEHDFRVRVAAWLALSRIGIAPVLPAVIACIGKSGEPSYWAIQCAARDAYPELLPALRAAALDTKDPMRMKLAQRALRKSHGVDQTREFYVDVFRKAPSKRRATAAALGLGNLKDKGSFHALVKLLEENKNKRVRLKIIKGLEVMTGHYFKPDPDVWKDWYKVVKGEVSYDPKPIERDKNRARVKKNREFGVSPATELAVERGLLWLTKHQDTNGGWNGATFHEHRPNSDAARMAATVTGISPIRR